MEPAWLIYGRTEYEKNRFMVQEYEREGAAIGINFRLLIAEELYIGIYDNRTVVMYQGKNLSDTPLFAVVRVINPLLNRQLEAMGIRVFNSAEVSAVCNDKARTHQYVAQTGVPMMNTRFVRNHQLREVLEAENGEHIVKAVDGHGGSQVFLYRKERLSEVLKGIGTSDAIIQPFLKTKSSRDLRVYVLGTEIVCAIMRSARSGYRANFSLGGECSLYSLRQDDISMIRRIIDLFSFGLVGIDFLIDDEERLIFNEIEDVVGLRMVYHCTDIPMVKQYLNWICVQLRK